MTTGSQTATQEVPPGRIVGEWFWRFLATALLFMVGWVLWIAYQLNPPILVTTAAFEAAARAKATQNASGPIATKPEAEASKAEQPKPEAAPKEPPVNLERLKLSDSITAPLAQDAKKN